MTDPLPDGVEAWSESEDGHIAILFTDGSLALINDPPPTEAEVLEAAAHFLPGREPFYIRRSDRIPKAVYIYPIEP